MARRSKAREVALQTLYQKDLNTDIDADTIREMIGSRLRNEALREFAWKLFVGVMEWRSVLDKRIESVAENWSLSRMAPTDRNILRLGAFEILYAETPHRVAIDEALELAKRYGTAQSSSFVNGLLDRLVPREKKEEGEGPSTGE